MIDSMEDEPCGGIPGIHNRQLQFLGLLNCAYEACRRPNLPAVQVGFHCLPYITTNTHYLTMAAYQLCYPPAFCFTAVV